MGKKRAIIVHGWQGYPEEGWFPWLQEQLEQAGWDVQVPAMPRPEAPDIHVWVETLKQLIGTPDEDLILVGHSIGCQTIMRVLEDLPEDIHVGGAVFVAGWFTLQNLETDDERMIAQPWIETPLDFEKIRAHASTFKVILSDNDLWVPLVSTRQMFETSLRASVSVEEGKGHLGGGDGVIELPSVLEAVFAIAEHHGT